MDTFNRIACDVCGKYFYTAASLKMHKVKSHKNKASNVDVVETAGKKGSRCVVCQRCFPNASRLASHMQQLHQPPAAQESRETFPCNVCSKMFYTSTSLEMHVTKVHRKRVSAIHTCEPVPETSVKQQCTDYVANHVQQVHQPLVQESRETFSCNVCNKTFYTNASLSMHVMKMHGKKVSAVHAVEPVPETATKQQCTDCGRFFVNLNKHVKCAGKSHSSETPSEEGRTAPVRIVLSAEGSSEDPQPVRRTRSMTEKETIRRVVSPTGNTRKDLIREKVRRELETLKTACENETTRDGEDPLLGILTSYHNRLITEADNILTEKLSAEAADVISDPSQVDNVNREFRWTKAHEIRLNGLNAQAKNLKMPSKWTWAAKEGTEQFNYNHKRMQYLVEYELETVVKHCDKCKSTGILVGRDQTESECCVDCLSESGCRSEKLKTERTDAWNAVRPPTLEYHGLPQLYAGDKSVLALVQPVVTVRKNYMVSKKLRQESITLMNDSNQTWTKILPRTDLKDRFVVIERTSKDHTRKHIVANPERVRVWLEFLFQNHPEFIRMESNGELKLSNEALKALQSQSELGEVVDDVEYVEEEETSSDEDEEDTGDDQVSRNAVVQPAMESGFSSSDVYTFDRYPYLYLKAKDFLRIKQSGEIEILEDDQRRVPIYNVSATSAFPYLYLHGEKSPLDCRDYKMSRYLLKKQSVFAYRLADSCRYKWEYAEDDIHMMFQYARLVELMVSARTAWFLQQSPDVAHLPVNQVLEAFKHGFTSEDESLIDSKLPGLSSVMAQLPNSREKWFSERMGIEAMSRDFGDPNLFLTLNNSPRETYDTRLLLHKLECGTGAGFDPDHYERDTERFTELMNKHAVQMSVYLYRKTKMFLKAFLCDICGVQEKEPSGDWTCRDRLKEGYYWTRVEFTSTRGVQHWHCLAKLPGVLDTGVIGRMIQNGRVVRQELKCGNIKPERMEEAWEIVEVGLLAGRYATLFADSLSMASFYTEAMDVDKHDDGKVIDVDELRDVFVQDYREDRISMATHPVMRRFCDAEYCEQNRYKEMASVAAVSCMHHCISTICGGDSKGKGCRFDFPKKTMNHTVPGMMQVNSTQMEARMLLRRTCTRVPNVNEYFLLYWRCNHDMTVLIDAAHKMRYATKYAAKTGRYSELLNEVIEYLSNRSVSAMPPNMQVVLSQLLLADVSHRSFMTKQELAYHVMELPDIRRSFANVDVVGFYHRAYLNVSSTDNSTIVYSDRTDYSAYAERCRDNTVIVNRKNAPTDSLLTVDMLGRMTFRDFAETVSHEWMKDQTAVPQDIGETTTRKFMTRDVNSGHWVLKRRVKRRHIRFSTVLYTDAPCLYEPVVLGDSTTQTSFFSLPAEKRKQLYRAYMELICYVPWRDSPEESFLDEMQRSVLEDAQQDLEKDHRYSLRRLEMFWQVYMDRWRRGEVAPPGSQWRRDNQYSYSMFLTTRHNVDMHMRRLEHDGTLSARYEADEEVKDTGIDLHYHIQDEVDQDDYPSALNFLPPDTFKEVIEQEPPEMSEVVVAFPMQVNYQQMEELVRIDKGKLFLAQPPPSSVPYDSMTDVQRWAVDLGVDMQQQILYLCGKAGTGKTQVALKICEFFQGRVQAAAVTGKAASLLGGPTVHGMFNWGTYDRSQGGGGEQTMSQTKKTELQTFYENVDVFVIDEINAMSASMLAQVHKTMTEIFNPNRKKVAGAELPFGGKKMVFLGDPVQLKPVMGEPIYGGGMAGSAKASRVRGARGRRQTVYHATAKGQELYRKYIEPNCVLLCRGQRSCGLLQQICDRLRTGKQTDADRIMLTRQRVNLPDFVSDFTLHYDNESCTSTNWRQLWSECKSCAPPKYMHVCRASYQTRVDNSQVVDGLAALPAQMFKFAPDVLCVAVGCDVRLIKNLNVAAGLVNSATGTVVCVMYDNADCSALFAGKHPAPYCIVVSFAGFQGFRSKAGHRILPFPDQPQWVPVYRERFTAARSDLPSWIVQKQESRDCWREQFPLDLCRAMTCHRAQGQTLSNSSVAVSLGLDNPDRKLPPDIRSILYVALTRATQLKDLLVDYIPSGTWERITQMDNMQDVEASLMRKAQKFAELKGMSQQVAVELGYEPDYGDCAQEQKELEGRELVPARRQPTTVRVTDAELMAQTDDGSFSMLVRPVSKERHIGVDQGRRNFAIVAVDRELGQEPMVVGAGKFDLDLGERFTAQDVLVKLRQGTDLWSWMQQTDERLLPDVDRVIVHIEQMSVKNRHSKQFGVELGQSLQKNVVGQGKCVVKLSHPHLFRAGGVIECLGEQIVQELNLVTIEQARKRVRTACGQGDGGDGVCTGAKRTRTTFHDVEPSDVSSESDEDAAGGDVSYRHKKRMSASIFRYFVEADSAKEEDMKVKVCSQVREIWQRVFVQDPKIKLDDLGDALLHALNGILCGESKYRQLVPSSVSLHNNRTIVVSVCRDYTYWAVIHCSWNTFEVEDFGFDDTLLSTRYFKSPQTVQDIRETLLGNLETAMTDPSGGDTYRPADIIKMVAKQLKSFQDFTAKQAGALTQSTVKALQAICDSAAGTNSTLCQRNDKALGSMYIRTQHRSGHKFQVISSTGKLTNAMLSCFNWMQENALELVDKRKAFMKEKTKLAFFLRLQSLAKSSENQLEHLLLSQRVRMRLASDAMQTVDDCTKGMLAYLILIGINKNEQRVKAVAANYRRSSSKPPKHTTNQTAAAEGDASQAMEADVEPTPSTSSGKT